MNLGHTFESVVEVEDSIVVADLGKELRMDYLRTTNRVIMFYAKLSAES